jgi:hypothetical protein
MAQAQARQQALARQQQQQQAPPPQQQQQPQMRINRHGSISIGPGLSPLEQSLRRGTPP